MLLSLFQGAISEMGNNGAEDMKICGFDDAISPETTVEIKIKTLDSQTYTLRVDKCVNIFCLLYSVP